MRASLAIVLAIGLAGGCSSKTEIAPATDEATTGRARDGVVTKDGERMAKKGAVSPDAIVVSEKSLQSKEAEDIVESNILFVNALLGEYLTEEEVSADALRSYYVDYYLTQVNNGGFRSSSTTQSGIQGASGTCAKGCARSERVNT